MNTRSLIQWPLILILVLLVLPPLGIALAFTVALWPQEPQISAGSVLELDLSGELPESLPNPGISGLLGGAEPLTVKDYLDNLKKAAQDDRIKGIVVKLDNYGAGWAKTEELRDALKAFKTSGKFTLGYAEFLEERGYYLALALDEVYIVPQGTFVMNGFVNQSTHLPGLLAKLGIGVQYFAHGKYKSQSGQSFGLAAFTPPVKTMINSNLDTVYGRFVQAVAEGRKRTPDEVRNLIDTWRPGADWAVRNKLITGTAYWDQVEEKIRQKLQIASDEEVPTVRDRVYQTLPLSRFGLNQGEKIGLVYSVGLVVSGEGGDANILTSEASQGAQPIIDALRKAGEDDDIKAVVFRVDSPGGAGLGCDLVRREVLQLKAKKPVIVSMSDSAASGGYWVSMAATAIVAQPLTSTGSIGIWSVLPNLGQLNKNLDLNPETFKRGAKADFLQGDRPLNPAEAQLFDQELFGAYTNFVNLAAEGRGKTPQAMEQIAQGRTWLGSEALKLGLVDKLGGLDTAIDLAKEKAKITGSVEVVDLAPTPSDFDTLLAAVGVTQQQPLTDALAPLKELGIYSQISPQMLHKYRLFPLAEPLRIE